MTLVEILAVLAILSMLAVVLTVNIIGKMGTAKQGMAKTQIGQIRQDIELYAVANNGPPTSGQGLKILTADPKANWYIEPGKILDPWGHEFAYLVPGPNGQPFEIISYGADGQPGGTGDNADISSTSVPAK